MSKLRRPLALVLVTAALIGASGVAHVRAAAAHTAAAPVDREAAFLAALRERGYYDTLVDYLEWVADSPFASRMLTDRLPLERAVALAAQGRAAGRRSERARLLGEAAESFERFAAESTGAETVVPRLDALRQAANLRAEEALATLAELEQLPPAAADAGGEARASARKNLDAAAKNVDQIVRIAQADLAKLPQPAEIAVDPVAKSRRDLLRTRGAEGEYLGALVLFERTRTYSADEKDQRAKDLTDAGKRFAELVKKYRDTLAGASSLFYQGRCLQEQGQFTKALGCFDDLASMPTADPEFLKLAARAHRRRVEVYVAQQKWDEAIAKTNDWFVASRPENQKRPEWLEVAYRLSEAYQGKARAASKYPAQSRRAEADAERLLRFVAENPSEFQKEAQLALAASENPRPVSAAGMRYRTFGAALAAGRTALEAVQSLAATAKLARGANDAAARKLDEQIAARRHEATDALEQALELADARTPINDLNAARYYLCWLAWEDGRLHDAAVLGDFLATRYSDSDFAPGAAKVALAAYQRLAREQAPTAQASTATRSVPKARAATLAQLIASRWPDSSEASAAIGALLGTALSEGRIDDARALVAKLPKESRDAAELSIGAALWEKYLRETAGQTTEPSAETTTLRNEAGESLTRGFAAVQKQGAPTPASAAGALYLAQYLLVRGDAADALAVLEDKSVGPLTLVADAHPAASRVAFIQETFKTALQAYLSTDPPQRDQARAMMEVLERMAGQQTAAGRTSSITATYLTVGRQLQRQLRELSDAGQTEKAKRVADAFADVLARVAERGDTGQWATRLWLAQTEQGMAEGLAGDQARAHYEAARKAYEAILATAASDATYAPNPQAVLGVRVRLAACLSALGEHDSAIDEFVEILKARPTAIDMQKAAAAALASQGAATGRAPDLEQAIHGAAPQANGKNLIWGWYYLAQVADAQRQRLRGSGAADATTQANIKLLADLFFEASYNVVKTRLAIARLVTGSEREENLAGAKRNVKQLATLYPDLGGPLWKAKFDVLAAEIDKELSP